MLLQMLFQYPQELLEKENFESDLAEKIETNCDVKSKFSKKIFTLFQSQKLELAGLIANHEVEELYVVFTGAEENYY